MSVTSQRTTRIVYSGDVSGTENIEAATNLLSPGVVEIKTLASGANTITVPTGGTVARAVTIQPPVGNTVTITLKGITGDTGILLHPTDPFTLSLGSTVTSFVLTTSAILTGVRLYWS